MMKRWQFLFGLGLGLWWLFLYWEKVSADKMFCMYRAARGGSQFYSCERPWDGVLWQAFLPLAVIGGVELMKSALRKIMGMEDTHL